VSPLNFFDRKGGPCNNEWPFGRMVVNSSRTWKTGEQCRIAGAYRCQDCHAAGQETVRRFEAGRTIPMCDAGPEKDATWMLLKTGGRGVNASA
jgi:hypothetical protein